LRCLLVLLLGEVHEDLRAAAAEQR
jgi:hypothetical protein